MESVSELDVGHAESKSGGKSVKALSEGPERRKGGGSCSVFTSGLMHILKARGLSCSVVLRRASRNNGLVQQTSLICLVIRGELEPTRLRLDSPFLSPPAPTHPPTPQTQRQKEQKSDSVLQQRLQLLPTPHPTPPY